MSNTGKKIVLTLKQVNAITFAPTGLTEPNDPGEGADYIPPYTDYVSCPLSYSLACPIPIFSPLPNIIGVEFSLYNSVVDNPNVTGARVNAISHSITHSVNFSFASATPNYYSSSIAGLLPGTYTTNIQFLSGSSVVSTCTYTASVVVT